MTEEKKKITFDSPFNKSKNYEEEFARALRRIAREITKLIRGYEPTDQIRVEKLKRALRSYADILEPWAYNLVSKMLRSLDGQDRNAWIRYSKEMSVALRKEILNAPTGERMKELMKSQVELIRSLPLEAAEQVQEVVMENLYQGKRTEEIAEAIRKINPQARATLIARTEMSRAASKLTQARAEYVGSEGYIWRTSRDRRVRDSHRKMEGKYVKWTDPPTLDKMIGHAGCFPNCRCYPEPVIPENDYKKKEE